MKPLKKPARIADEFFDEYVTLDEFILLLKNQYSRSTIYRWVSMGLPHKKLGGKLWFNKNESINWLIRRFE